MAEHNGLLPWHKVPEDAREKFILSGYRPSTKFRLGSLVASAFQLHNETLNIWTHMLPMFYFLYFSIISLDCTTTAHGDLEGRLYPFYGYILSVCCLFGVSSLAHLCNYPGSPRDTFFMLDYCAICLYGVGAAVAFYAYSGPKTLVLIADREEVFLTVTVMLSLGACITCCWTRVMQVQFCHIIRTASFIAPFLYGSIPAISRCLHDAQQIPQNVPVEKSLSQELPTGRGDNSTILQMLNLEHPEMHTFTAGYIWHFALMLSAAVVNVSRVPERWYPGMFDLFGHSHQWFHTLIFLGIREQFWVTISDIRKRSATVGAGDYGHCIQPLHTFLCFGAMVCIQALIVIASRAKLSKQEVPCNGNTPVKQHIH